MHLAHNELENFKRGGRTTMAMYRRRALSVILILLLLSVAVLSAYCDEENWDCPVCGKKGNTGKFCGSCGQPAPTLSPVPMPTSTSRSTFVIVPTPDPESMTEPGDEAIKVMLPGDVTGDGTVDIADLIRLQKYLYGGIITVDTDASDMNGDDVVDLIDYIQLQKALVVGR